MDPGELLRVNGPLIAMGLGYLAAEWYAGKGAAARGLDAEVVRRVAPWVLVASIVVGRLAFVLPHAEAYLRRPVDLLIIRSGIDFYGGLAGAAAFAAWRARRVGVPAWAVLDLLALATLVGVAVQRGGCVLGNHCAGASTDSIFGVQFPGFAGARFPAQPVEAILALLVFGALVAAPIARVRVGLLFAGFLLSYGFVRFGVEFLRVTLEPMGPVSRSQVWAVVMMGVGGLVALVLVRGRALRTSSAGTGVDPA